ENILGFVNDKPSRAKSIVLRNNRIKNRHYAIDENGNPTHTNAEMTAEAIKNLTSIAGISKNDIEILSCGTSSPDQIIPSHATMVHGCLKNNPIELNSANGICTSGMNALKYGYLAIAANNAKLAVCTGSERISSWLRSDKFNNEAEKL